MDDATAKEVIQKCIEEYDKLGRERAELNRQIREFRSKCPHTKTTRHIIYDVGLWGEMMYICDVCGERFIGI